jgi:hypothetical protein
MPIAPSATFTSGTITRSTIRTSGSHPSTGPPLLIDVGASAGVINVPTRHSRSPRPSPDRVRATSRPPVGTGKDAISSAQSALNFEPPPLVLGDSRRITSGGRPRPIVTPVLITAATASSSTTSTTRVPGGTTRTRTVCSNGAAYRTGPPNPSRTSSRPRTTAVRSPGSAVHAIWNTVRETERADSTDAAI